MKTKGWLLKENREYFCYLTQHGAHFGSFKNIGSMGNGPKIFDSEEEATQFRDKNLKWLKDKLKPVPVEINIG